MMNPLYIDQKKPVTLLGGGKFAEKVFNQALKAAPILLAADGGAGRALELGHIPKAVIGDMDSLDEKTAMQIPPDHLYPIGEQDSTDFDKCLRSIRAPLILGVGFTGWRLDHELAAYSSLLRHPEQRCILLGEVDMCFLAPVSMRLDLPAGTRVSLFPLAPCRVDATGLRWQLDGLKMAPDGVIGTSNEVLTGPVTLQVSKRKLLVILPHTYLGAAIKALTGGKDGQAPRQL